MKKRVVHVINSLTPGGAETLLANSLADGGLQEHTENTVVYFQGTSTLEDKIDKRITCHNLNYKGLLSLPRTLLKLRKIIKNHNADIVHSHLNPAGFYTHLVCPVPHVHTLHTTYSKNTETKPFKLFLEKQLYFKKKDCDIILLSDFIKEDFMRSVPFKGKAFVLNNFVADSFFRSSGKTYDPLAGSLKLVAVGRLSEVKNFSYLIDVFMHLKDKEIYLDIYGAGDIEKYQKRINEVGIKVTMKGHNQNMTEVLGNYDVFIMPSKFEGFSLSLFEAMAAGVPLMLSNVTSLTSIVKDNAIYFELDNAEKVAQQLISVLQNEVDINRMAAKAILYAEKTVRREIYIEKLLSIYDTVLQPDKK